MEWLSQSKIEPNYLSNRAEMSIYRCDWQERRLQGVADGAGVYAWSASS
jgi:hypothetical protein